MELKADATLDGVSHWGSHSNGSSKTGVRARSAASEPASLCLGHQMSPGSIGQPRSSTYTGSENRGCDKRPPLRGGCGAGITPTQVYHPGSSSGSPRRPPQALTSHFAPFPPSSLLHLGLGSVLLVHLPHADPLAGDTQVSDRL